MDTSDIILNAIGSFVFKEPIKKGFTNDMWHIMINKKHVLVMSQPTRKKSKLFSFTDSKSCNSLNIVIPEVLDASYGMYVWPCAPVLAQYVWKHKHLIEGKLVLEIGAGTSLPGVVAAKCGANVILSDSAGLLHCQENCRQSCIANELTDIPVMGLTWGCFEPDLLELPPIDYILGSDCFYDTKDFEDVLVTISFLLEKNQHAEFWSTYQERSSERSIAHLLRKWRLTCTHIPLGMFDADKAELAGSDLPGNHTIQMLVIKGMQF